MSAAGGSSSTFGGALRTTAPDANHGFRELLVRRARQGERTVVVLRAIDHGDRALVEAEVFPQGRPGTAPLQPGPYVFASAAEATAFVADALEALMCLGCEVDAG